MLNRSRSRAAYLHNHRQRRHLRFASPRLDDALRQWALMSIQGDDVGPAHQYQCGSAEGNYVSSNVFQDDMPAPLPDADIAVGERVDDAWRRCQPTHRDVLKIHYIGLFFVPVHRSYDYVNAIGARLLRTTPGRYEHRLHDARQELFGRLFGG